MGRHGFTNIRLIGPKERQRGFLTETDLSTMGCLLMAIEKLYLTILFPYGKCSVATGAPRRLFPV